MFETKTVRLYSRDHSRYNESNRYISDLLNFGWVKADIVVERHRRGSHEAQALVRDTDIAHYSEFQRLEKEYDRNKKSEQRYEPMSGGTAFILLLLLILPGIIYIIYKNLQKNSIETHNANCNASMVECVEKAKRIRTTQETTKKTDF